MTAARQLVKRQPNHKVLLIDLRGHGVNATIAGPHTVAAAARDVAATVAHACGPDAPTSLELFGALRDAVGGPGVVVPARGLLSTRAITALTRPIDWYTGDTLLDADDLDLLASGLTRADDPGDPAIAARRSLLAWIADRGPDLGRRYVSSVARYYR